MENWRDIPGYEGAYQASDMGRIRSLDRNISQVSRHGSIFSRVIKGRILRPGRYTKSGHVSVVLGKGTPGKPVHQLVMVTFVGPASQGQEVRHKNGDPTDNRLSNLEYGTRRENILDTYKPGKAWRKLSVSDVHDIRHKLREGVDRKLIAEEYGITQTTISDIKGGKTYGWLHSG